MTALRLIHMALNIDSPDFFSLLGLEHFSDSQLLSCNFHDFVGIVEFLFTIT